MIWNACHGENHIGTLSNTLYRMVESQEQVATMGYVDTLDEQALLEEMLEQAKPLYPEEMHGYHYLLTTPFRYPPLEWGSRFGKTNEPSLFYGGCTQSVTLAESAYYRFVFLHSIEGVSDDDKMRSEHSMFSVDYQTAMGMQLQSTPFDRYQTELTDPQNYSHTQQLGRNMRAAGVDAFEYKSARAPNNGLCVGLYNVAPFPHNNPQNMTQWLCETSSNQVLFKQFDDSTLAHFSLTTFLINGVLPLPA